MMARSEIDSLLILNPKQNSHGVLVLHKAHTRLAYGITQKSLGLRLHLSDLFQGDHEELVLRRPQGWLTEKYSNRLTILVPMSPD